MTKTQQTATAAEVARMLGVSKRTVHRRAKGELASAVVLNDTTGLHFDRAKISQLGKADQK